MANLITLDNLARFKTNCDEEYMKKQSIDATPTDNSESLITSGGVKSYVDNAVSNSGGDNTWKVTNLGADYNLDSLTTDGFYKVDDGFSKGLYLVHGDGNGKAVQIFLGAYAPYGDFTGTDIRYRMYSKGWKEWQTLATVAEMNELKARIAALEAKIS